MMQFTNQKLLALLSPLPLINVLHDPNAIEKLALVIEHAGRRHRDPRRGAVLSDVSLLNRVVLQFTLHMTGEKLALGRSIARMRQVTAFGPTTRRPAINPAAVRRDA